MEREPPPPDATAFGRAQRGEQVLDELISEYLPRLRAFVRSNMSPELRRLESCSDLVQSVCRGLLVDEEFRFRGEPEFRSWLFLAATNKIRERHRYYHKQKRDVEREVQVDPAASHAQLANGYATMGTPSQVAATAEQIAKLETALDRLSDEHREVIALTKLAGLTSEEVGERLGRSAGAVRQLLGRALLKLSSELKKQS